jgi:branched-chain amino acid aminotransferase
LPSAAQTDSFTACISSYRKHHPESVPVHAKAAGFYVNSYLALMEAAERGFDEAVLLDTMGYVAEGGTSNIFMIKDGMLMTPSLRSILPGITRQFILEIAAEFMKCLETDLTVAHLLSADEVFFSNSVERIMPIRRIGDSELGESAPGTYTQKIMKTINDVIDGVHPAFARWLIPVE